MDRAPMRLRDTPAALLLIVLMLISGQRLYLTNWTTGLATVLVFCLLGAIVGFWIGTSRFNRPVTFLLWVGYSLAVVPLVTLWSLYNDVPWVNRLPALADQISISATQLFTSQAVEDPTMYLVFAYVMYWFISLAAGYNLARYGKFAGVVGPAGVALVIIQLFDMRESDHVYILAVYVFLCLLLLGRLNYLRQRDHWKQSHVWVSGEAITDLNLIMGVAALGLVIMTWIAPVSGRPVTSARIWWEDLTRSWRERQQDLNKSIQSLQNNRAGTVEIYGDSLALGHQAVTGTDTFARVTTPLVGGAVRYYWRVRTYDLFRNDQWYSNYAFDEPFIPSEGSLAVVDSEGVSAEFAFIIPNQNVSTLLTPSRPNWTNRYSRLTFTPTIRGKIDPLMFVASPTILAGQEYLVHANIYQPSIASLRSAGVNYPTWVIEHYLQLPPDLPPEIPALANRVAAGLQTPYDQAQAITDYLRTNIKYSAIVGTPPSGRDLLSWFLFDSKAGFCNYYATAEVVLLRSLGIPARLVVGYAQGEFDPPNHFTIKQKDAHAWPEVYFPDNGWMEFEPTASQPPLVRPATGDATAGLLPTPTPAQTPGGNNPDQPIPIDAGGTAAGVGRNPLLRLTFLLLAVLLIIGLFFAAYSFGIFDRLTTYLQRVFQKPVPILMKSKLEDLNLTVPGWLNRWAYLAALTPVERAFTSVYRGLYWLGKKASPSQTPAEAAAALSRLIPSVSTMVHVLLEQCEHSLYSERKIDLPLARRAAEAIQTASLRAAIQARWRVLGSIFSGRFKTKEHTNIP